MSDREIRAGDRGLALWNFFGTGHDIVTVVHLLSSHSMFPEHGIGIEVVTESGYRTSWYNFWPYFVKLKDLSEIEKLVWNVST